MGFDLPILFCNRVEILSYLHINVYINGTNNEEVSLHEIHFIVTCSEILSAPLPELGEQK